MGLTMNSSVCLLVAVSFCVSSWVGAAGVGEQQYCTVLVELVATLGMQVGSCPCHDGASESHHSPHVQQAATHPRLHAVA
jgi:hypothetical protein